jgi:hypothetical protein
MKQPQCLTLLVSDHPASRLDELLPWNRRKSSATLAA